MTARNDNRRKHPNLKVWEHPKGSKITIGEIINRTRGKDYSGSYRVCIPKRISGKERILRQFPTKEAAFKFAALEFSGKQQYGERHFALTAPQREDALTALNILRGTDIGLISAVRFAVKHLKPPAGEITVKDLLAQFLDEKAAMNLRERSLKDMKSRLGIFAASFGEKHIKDISQKDIEGWLKGMQLLSARSRKNYRQNVAAFFNYAIEKEFCSLNPVNKIPVPKEDWNPPCVLTIEEAKRLVQTAHRTHYRGNEEPFGLGLLPYVALGLFAGIRSSELNQLDWRNISLDRKLATIPHTIAKKRRLRNIDLEENCIQWLRLVERKTGKITPSGINKKFKILTVAAGFPDWKGTHTNAQRHSFGSYMFAKTQDAQRTAALLGHRGDDQVLFDHYRSLATKEDGERYFSITPESIDGKLVAFPKVAG